MTLTACYVCCKGVALGGNLGFLHLVTLTACYVCCKGVALGGILVFVPGVALERFGLAVALDQNVLERAEVQRSLVSGMRVGSRHPNTFPLGVTLRHLRLATLNEQ